MASFIFMQPGEQKGSYKHRSVTVTASQIEERGYINLDHMTNGGEKSLKWGAHAYCGRVKAPLGVTIKAFKNWDASGSPAKTIVGRGMRRAVDFWDYHNRMCSFRVEPPVKVIRIKMSARNLMSKDTASGTMKFDQKVSVGCTRNQSTATKVRLHTLARPPTPHPRASLSSGLSALPHPAAIPAAGSICFLSHRSTRRSQARSPAGAPRPLPRRAPR